MVKNSSMAYFINQKAVQTLFSSSQYGTYQFLAKVFLFVLFTVGILCSMINTQFFYETPPDSSHIEIHAYRRNTLVNSNFEKKSKIIEEVVKTLVDNTLVFKSYRKLQEQTTQHLSVCEIYSEDGKHEKFHVSQIWKEELSIPTDDITYVTQVTLDRFHMIETILNQWSGPLSISIYLDIDEISHFKETIFSYPSIFERDNIDFHVCNGYWGKSVFHKYIFDLLMHT